MQTEERLKIIGDLPEKGEAATWRRVLRVFVLCEPLIVQPKGSRRTRRRHEGHKGNSFARDLKGLTNSHNQSVPLPLPST